jgi:hypothetical protein
MRADMPLTNEIETRQAIREYRFPKWQLENGLCALYRLNTLNVMGL